MDYDRLWDFQLVGARFSKISVDESVIGDAESYSIKVNSTPPVVSKHKYGERPVIELTIGIAATPSAAKQADALSHVFIVECTAGFVGKDPAADGDLSRFKTCLELFSRSVYWMLRERLDSIFAITTLRSVNAIPWDMMREQDVKQIERHTRATKKKKSAVKRASH
jgi:hypothetical protein